MKRIAEKAGSLLSVISDIRDSMRMSETTITRYVLFDDFERLNESLWGDAINCPYYSGIPQTVSAGLMDGRSVIKLRSDMTNFERRGYGTHQSFVVSQPRVEVDFKPVSGVDGILELWLTCPQTGEYLAIGVYGDCWGIKRLVKIKSSIDAPAETTRDMWDYGRWYRFHIESDTQRTRLSFRSSEDIEIWGHTYRWPLGAIGEGFNLNLTQQLGSPGSGLWKAEAAVDRVAVASSMISVGNRALNLIPALRGLF